MSSDWIRTCARRCWDSHKVTEPCADGLGHRIRTVPWPSTQHLSAVVELIGFRWRWTLFGASGRVIEYGERGSEAAARRAAERRAEKASMEARGD